MKKPAPLLLGLAASLALAPATALARKNSDGHTAPETKPMQDLARCKAIAADQARLACYDTAAGALLAAEQRADVIVVDRGEVEKARSSLFGLSMPDISLFKRHGAKMEELDHVEGVLASADTNSSGQYIFHLQDGATWQQVDTYEVGKIPRSGDPVVIKRAALNSYKLSVAGHAAVRVQRIH
jgi:hypothetical protein